MRGKRGVCCASYCSMCVCVLIVERTTLCMTWRLLCLLQTVAAIRPPTSERSCVDLDHHLRAWFTRPSHDLCMVSATSPSSTSRLLRRSSLVSPCHFDLHGRLHVTLCCGVALSTDQGIAIWTVCDLSSSSTFPLLPRRVFAKSRRVDLRGLRDVILVDFCLAATQNLRQSIAL